MNYDHLSEELPKMTERLRDMMINEAIPVLKSMPAELGDVAWPSVSITYNPRDGSEPFKVTLSLEAVDAVEVDGEGEDDDV